MAGKGVKRTHRSMGTPEGRLVWVDVGTQMASGKVMHQMETDGRLDGRALGDDELVALLARYGR